MRNQRDEPSPTVIDTETWLQEARQANHLDAMQWFTRTILQQTYTNVHSRKRSRTLNSLHAQWGALLTRMEEPTRRHPRKATQTSQATSLCAH